MNEDLIIVLNKDSGKLVHEGFKDVTSSDRIISASLRAFTDEATVDQAILSLGGEIINEFGAEFYQIYGEPLVPIKHRAWQMQNAAIIGERYRQMEAADLKRRIAGRPTIEVRDDLLGLWIVDRLPREHFVRLQKRAKAIIDNYKYYYPRERAMVALAEMGYAILEGGQCRN